MNAVAIVPAFNEARSIADVVTGLHGIVSHVLIVDDGSTDQTAARARAAGAEVLTRGTNTGKGSAIRAGLAHVAEPPYVKPRPFTHVLLLDGDMQHRPSEALRLLDAAERTGADLVLGEREFSREGMPAARYHANRIGSRVLSWFVGAPVQDTQCGFRVCRLDALRDLPLRARGYEIETEMLVKLRRRGARLASVPITAVYAAERSKLRPVRDTTRTCFLAVYYQFLERI
jgi:glycosyltransferase involved in cell wall biosynthesis